MVAKKKAKKRSKKPANKGKKRVSKAKKKRVIRKKITKKKRLAKKKVQRRAATVKKPKEKILGIVTHYFPRVRAAAIRLKAPLNVGDNIRIKGHTTDFTQAVTSLQIERVPINNAKKGQEIGLLVNSRVRRRDAVYKA